MGYEGENYGDDDDDDDDEEEERITDGQKERKELDEEEEEEEKDKKKRIEKIRNMKDGNLEVKKLGSGITLTKKLDGKISLSTKSRTESSEQSSARICTSLVFGLNIKFSIFHRQGSKGILKC